MIATVLLPVSLLGADALEEVFDQARDLLAFKPVSAGPFYSTQIAFNLLPTPDTSAALLAQLSPLVGEEIVVSTHLLQASIFHSLALSLYVELGADTTQTEVVAALSQNPHVELADESDQLGPIDAASREHVLVGDVRTAPGRPGGRLAAAQLCHAGERVRSLHGVEPRQRRSGGGA